MTLFNPKHYPRVNPKLRERAAELHELTDYDRQLIETAQALDGLSTWEMDFLEGIALRERLSSRELEKLRQIIRERA